MHDNIIMEDAITDDGFLGGRLSALQPARHGRAGIDAVILAAAVPCPPGERVLELGSGTGVASLCLAARVSGVRIDGCELQEELVAYARANAARNDFGETVRFEPGDIRALASLGEPSAYDGVMMNPPYHPAGTTRPSPRPAKSIAHAELTGSLDQWVAAALRALRPGGHLTLIHRADRLGAVLRLLQDRAGGIEIIPLWPAEGRPAKRIVVRARKDSAAPSILYPGLALHRPDGAFTEAADAILRGGGALMP